MKKALCTAILALTLLYGVEARAIIFGVRLSNSLDQRLPAVFGDFGSSGRFGVYLGTSERTSIFLAGADYDRIKLERGDSLLYARRITVNLGYRYLLITPDKAKAMSFMPYLSGHIFKSFSKVEADSAILPQPDVTYYHDILNDSGAWLALGADYFFAPAFSLGAEGGLRYTRANSKAFGYDIKLRKFNTYAALLLSFYW